MASVDFGIFDHLDRRPDTALGQTYEDRLRLIEAYDRAGFYTYQVAEHHATPLTVAPAPSVFLAAVAQRTTRLRFGPMVYVLPLYHPLRLIEEICMLDQMSGGRLDLGVGRGISPYELDYFGVEPGAARALYDEVLDIVLAGLQTDRLTHHGARFDFDDVPIGVTPVQTPHPPLWVGIGTLDGAARAGAAGANVLTNSPLDFAAELVARYREAYAAGGNGGDDGLPRMAVCRHTYVAETDEAAESIMREAYAAWYRHFVQLWREHGAEPVIAQYTDDFDETKKKDLFVYGSPARVREEIERSLETSGTNYFVCRFAYGSLTYRQSRDALDLFVDEVMPHFRAA